MEESSFTQNITDDLDVLLAVLPPAIERAIRQRGQAENLLEIILDLGRPPTARYTDGEVVLSDEELPLTMIEHVITRIGEFDADNRAGMPRTLHRISGIRNRRGHVVGLTCRVGRAVYGTVDIIQDIVSSGKSVLMMGRPGVGKCIAGDSLILTHKGLEPLAALIPDNLADDEFAPADTSVYGRRGMEPASHVYNGGLSETLKITTRQGFELEGTPEHPVLALTESGGLAFRRLEELKPGDYLAIQRGQQLFGTHTELPVFEFQRRTNAMDSAMPGVLDEGLARFLGYLVAEGTLSFDNQVCFSNTAPEVQADMAQLTERLFGLTMRRHLSGGAWNGKDFRIFGVKLRRFLLQLGLAQSRAADKSIPPCVLSAPKPVVTSFLQALFEGDGSIYGSNPRVDFASASRRLIAQLHVLLLNYGVVGNMRAKHNSQYDRDYYVLTLLGENVARYAAEIGFLSSTKRARLEQSVAKLQLGTHNPNVDVVPLQNDRLRTLRMRAGVSSATPIGRYTHNDNRAPSYRALAGILSTTRAAAAEPEYQALQTLEAAHYFFDPVTRIQAGENYVYDLTVPGTHSFFANGFVSHNTTMLREAARVLAEKNRVVIVDTSNEIGGDGDIAHPAVGRARRMQVATPSLQHEVMIEAVENHNPQVIIIDEIGRELEAQAARTIAERGVQLIGTAHGNTLENLLLNPTLSDLVGGIESVTLSDEEARRRGTQKTVLERRAPPTFPVLIEIVDRQRLRVHLDVAAAVDSFLRGRLPLAQIRSRDENGQVHIDIEHSRYETAGEGNGRSRRTGRERTRPGREGREEPPAAPSWAWTPENAPGGTPAAAESAPRVPAALPAAVPSDEPEPEPVRRPMSVYAYGVARNRLEQAARRLRLPFSITEDLDAADAIVTLKSYYRQRPGLMTDAERHGTPVYVLRSNTMAQIERFLADLFNLELQPPEDDDPLARAIRETEEAVQRVQHGERSVDLAPQSAYIRRRQHQLARQANLISHSYGKEPFRRVRIYRE